jgi:hypothetical protein
LRPPISKSFPPNSGSFPLRYFFQEYLSGAKLLNGESPPPNGESFPPSGGLLPLIGKSFPPNGGSFPLRYFFQEYLAIVMELSKNVKALKGTY